MQGLELLAPPLLAETDLLSAHQQLSSPPAPPGPVHQFPEPQDTNGHRLGEGPPQAWVSVWSPSPVQCFICLTSRLCFCSYSYHWHTRLQFCRYYRYHCHAGIESKVFLTTVYIWCALFMYRKYNKRWRWRPVCCLKTVCVVHRFIIYVCAGSISRTTLYQKRRQEEAVAAGLEQPPPVQRKHKKHKVHEFQKCNKL